MTTPIDLRRTYGWHLSKHARDAADARGVTTREILEAIAAPEIRHTAYNCGPGREMYKHGELAVVGVPATKTVITVLWNSESVWTSEEFHEFRRHRRTA